METKVSGAIIRDATKKDIKELKFISDVCIGENYITEEDFLSILNSEKSFLRVVVREDDIPASFMYSLVTSAKEAKALVHIPDDMQFMALSNADLVGIIKTAGTKSEYRRRGDFSFLAKDAQEIMTPLEPKVVISAGLRDPDGDIHIKGAMEKQNFKAITEIKSPWIDIDCPCPHCKKQFCICDAVIYGKYMR